MRENAKKLLEKIQTEMERNEYRMSIINGKKCSYADLEEMEMLLEYYIKNGNFGNFRFYGEVREILGQFC